MGPRAWGCHAQILARIALHVCGVADACGGADADFFSGGTGKDTATDFNAGQGDTQDGMIP